MPTKLRTTRVKPQRHRDCSVRFSFLRTKFPSIASLSKLFPATRSMTHCRRHGVARLEIWVNRSNYYLSVALHTPSVTRRPFIELGSRTKSASKLRHKSKL